MQNFIANTCHSARFYDVTNMSDIRGHGASKNIVRMLEQKANKMTSGEFECLIGFVMDSTKANWRVMLVLKEKYPTMINRGCLAHSLSSMLKAFCKNVRGHGWNAGKNTQGMQRAQGVVEWANKLANFVQDGTDVKSLVRGLACGNVHFVKIE
jgi:hypothetical protein